MTHKRMTSHALTLIYLLMLGGCGYAVDSSNQDITFVTPGAENAYCDVFIDKRRYQVYPPQKINMVKSSKDMEVECVAPGNRELKLVVPSKMSARSMWGGPPGMAWDYASSSLFYYPSVIAIDFSNESPKPNDLPDHNSIDIDQPETHQLEEIKASTPLLNSDKDKKSIPLIRREEAIAIEQEDAAAENPVVAEQESKDADKGSLMNILERLGTSDAASDSNSDVVVPEGSAKPVVAPDVKQGAVPAGTQPPVSLQP